LNRQRLERLTQTSGPSGYEDDIRAVIAEELEGRADEVRTDALGSLVAFRKGANHDKTLLLAAHMDEIGLMVTHVEEKGFVRFTSVGGIRAVNSIGSRVRFANGTLGTLSVERREDGSKVPQLHHLYIDVGASDQQDAPVRVGDTATFIGPLASQGSRWISKAMDDRIGCYILIELLERLVQPATDVFFVFSTQEEITLSGARTSAFRIDPDMAVSIDVTTTGDTPKALPMDVALGKGPAIKVKDSGMIAHPDVRDRMIEVAEALDLPYQLEVLLRGSTDAAAMQLVRAGVPSGCVSIPCRYVHSTTETVDEADVEHAIQLLHGMIRSTS
jgi:tetrahedral aminopeptidase